MNKLFISLFLAFAFVLAGCSATTPPIETTEPTNSETGNLSTAAAVIEGEQAKSDFLTIAKATASKAANGVTETLNLPDGIQILIFDPTSKYKHNAIFFQEWTEGYGAYESTDMFIAFSATTISEDKETIIQKLSDGVWRITNGNAIYDITENNGVVTNVISATADGTIQWTAKVDYFVNDENKSHVTEANEQLGFKE